MFLHNIFQVEPGTRLFPAVIAEPTIKEMLQFELGSNRVNIHALSLYLISLNVDFCKHAR